MIMKKTFAFCLALALFCGNSRAADPVHIYQAGDNGYAAFRIPALVTTSKGTVLAFAEGRKQGLSDTGDIDLVLRRSTDGGKTWGDMIVVWDDGVNVCGNPAPVVLADGRILLLSTWNNGDDPESAILDRTSKESRRVFVMDSGDDGLSWSKPREITEQVKLADWTWYATGPCHALLLQQGEHAGRIVVPANHGRWMGDRSAYFSHLIYSDDQGETWKIGAQGTPEGGSESSVVQLVNGQLVVNTRDERRVRPEGPGRLMAQSRDGGQSYFRQYRENTLVDPKCQGAMIAFVYEGRPTSTLLFSNPVDSVERIRMTITTSFDGGRTWGKPVKIYPGPSAYSDLSMLPSGDVAILYENGEQNPYERITFETLTGSYFDKE